MLICRTSTQGWLNKTGLKRERWLQIVKRSCVNLEVQMVLKTHTVTLKMMTKQLLVLVSLRQKKIMRMMIEKSRTITKTSIRSLTQTTHKAKKSDNLKILGQAHKMTKRRIKSSQSEQSLSLSSNSSNQMTRLTNLSILMKSSPMTMGPQSWKARIQTVMMTTISITRTTSSQTLKAPQKCKRLKSKAKLLRPNQSRWFKVLIS